MRHDEAMDQPRRPASPTFVGIDLAWSYRSRTGLATVNLGGRLVASGSCVTDAEIDAWLADHASSASVIAVDAPLIVRNPSGRREAEALVGQAYQRYGAGAYPSNRGNPMFDPPRAELLAERHGWDVDPHGDGRRPRCIEVYPHPALVAWFRLRQRLLYKKGADRQGEFTRLADFLETIPELRLAEDARWAELRRDITSSRPVVLDRAEDEIDAIVCAHLAWLWHMRPGSLQVYGTVADGYIVAPPPPTHPSERLTGVRGTEPRVKPRITSGPVVVTIDLVNVDGIDADAVHAALLQADLAPEDVVRVEVRRTVSRTPGPATRIRVDPAPEPDAGRTPPAPS